MQSLVTSHTQTRTTYTFIHNQINAIAVHLIRVQPKNAFPYDLSSEESLVPSSKLIIGEVLWALQEVKLV